MSPIIIHTEGSGQLAADCPETYVQQVAAQMADAQHVVVHLHGGLVSEKAAREMASRLDPHYRQANLLPVFFAWETGILETIPNNLARIGEEKIFKTLLGKLLRHVAGKVLLDTPGAKSAISECPLPAPIEVQAKMQAAEKLSVEPYADETAIGDVAETTQAEKKRLEEELTDSIQLEKEVAEILGGQAMVSPPGSKGAGQPILPVQTKMSPHVLVEMEKEASVPGSRGLFSTAALAKHAVTVLVRVIRRFAQKRDHGIYATLVEELLRELYIDSIGGLVWGSMKKDARDNFSNPKGGGALLMKEFAAALDARSKAGLPLPKLSVVGHSAGTIFACHLLRHLASQHPKLTLHKLIFMAAACRCDLFDEVLKLHAQKTLWADFRSYALSDELEKGYWEVKAVYPRSLLYLVSGLFETENDEPAWDVPLVGMQRYIQWQQVYQQPAITAVRAFLTATPERHVWSTEDSGPGRRSDAIKHGGFDDTTGDKVQTMQSVVEFL